MARAGRTKGQAKQEILLYPEYILLTAEDLHGYLSRHQGVHITLELGMGAGDMLLAMAARHPEEIFIGVELKEERCLKMAVRAKQQGLQNIICVCLPGAHIYKVFHEFPVENLWITFPDPWPKKHHRWRRFITYTTVVSILKLLTKDGRLFFKTDHRELFWDTHLVLRHSQCTLLFTTENLHTTDFPNKEMTAFERKYVAQNKPIYLLEAQKK